MLGQRKIKLPKAGFRQTPLILELNSLLFVKVNVITFRYKQYLFLVRV
jgi:hypothetical protein